MTRGQHSRHVRGDTGDILMEIRGNVVVESGDMMFLNDTAGDLGATWTADNRAYPFNWARGVTAGVSAWKTVHDGFLGVAMKASRSGTTEKIAIATKGVFRMDNSVNGAVTAGALVSAVTASGQGVPPQDVYTGVSATMTAPASTAYLGYCVKTESGATAIDFEIRTIYGSLIGG